MQRYCTELTERLLKSLDKEYNVVDMGAVVDVITALEKKIITKEVLEETRLGKHINELRRKTTNEALAKRAKDLVRWWRDTVLPSSGQQHGSNPPTAPPNPVVIDNTSSHQTLNGTKPASPLVTAARTVKPRSPVPGSAATRIKPQSPLMRDATTAQFSVAGKNISPSLSLNSDSCSPNSTPIKLPIVTSNYKLNTAGSPKLSGTSNQNHSIEAVPRTHSSNKRLRKEDTQQQQINSPHQQQYDVNSTSRDELTSITVPVAKKQRVNGDFNININSQVPNSPSSSSTSTRNEGIVNPVLDSSLSGNLSTGTATAKTEPVPPVGPKKRGRKKGSKSVKSQSLSEDRVKEKLASISRNPKLKTTQEILADIQVRNVSGALGTTTTGPGQLKREPPTTDEILRNTEINNRNLASNNNTRTKIQTINRYESQRLSAGSTTPAGPGADQHLDTDGVKAERVAEPDPPSIEATLKEILSKLPPLDLDAIRWSDDETNNEDELEHKLDDQDNTTTEDRVKITDDQVERLHTECIESLNGNFQMKLNKKSVNKEVVDDIDESVSNKIVGVYKRRVVDDDTEREFREWHEMLARPSFDGQILHILPYVIID
ncbi:mediator of RNA polymerase II transcription subunit 26 isoform X1 [Microplitis demolitor]|uniref:mediator of RNA polymerase II transcription subunit 26 isoform X1 n=2 Tax=Microplitis demolitor TaxID=69319 RepID=UPI0004CDA453|nr:mediator of RNA polymerase II transcription subunit 26 isoform X1 [Microplitis demolitor]